MHVFFILQVCFWSHTSYTSRRGGGACWKGWGACLFTVARQTDNEQNHQLNKTNHWEQTDVGLFVFFFTIAYCDVWHDMSNDFRNCCLWDKTSFGSYLYDMHIMRLWRGMHWCFVLWATTICISAILQTCSSLYNAPHWNTLYTSCSSCSAVIKLAVLRALATWWMTHVVFAWF